MQGISPKGMPPFVDREPQSKVVIGLGYGDEGKGMAVAHETLRALAHGLRVVNVRFNGGPQAAHNVRVMVNYATVLHHTHSQFGSGSMFGALTVLMRFVIVSEVAYLNIVMPFLVPLALAAGVNPWVVGFAMYACISPWFVIYQNSVYLPALYSVDGQMVHHADVAKYCFVYTAICLAALAASVPYWQWMGLM